MSGEGTLCLEGSGEAHHPITVIHSLLLWPLEASMDLVMLLVIGILVHARSGEMRFLRQVWVREGSGLWSQDTSCHSVNLILTTGRPPKLIDNINF